VNNRRRRKTQNINLYEYFEKTPMKNKTKLPNKIRSLGFSLSELLATFSNVGILSSTALPNYFDRCNELDDKT